MNIGVVIVIGLLIIAANAVFLMLGVLYANNFKKNANNAVRILCLIPPFGLVLLFYFLIATFIDFLLDL